MLQRRSMSLPSLYLDSYSNALFICHLMPFRLPDQVRENADLPLISAIPCDPQESVRVESVYPRLISTISSITLFTGSIFRLSHGH